MYTFTCVFFYTSHVIINVLKITGKLHKKYSSHLGRGRGTQILGTRSPRQLNSVWLRLIFVGPQCDSYSLSPPPGTYNSEVAPKLLQNLCTSEAGCHCTKWIYNVVDVAINKQLIRFQNCLNFLLQLCHGKVEKTFPYFQCLHGQYNTVLLATDCPQASVPMGVAYLMVLILTKIHPKYIKKASNILIYHSHQFTIHN